MIDRTEAVRDAKLTQMMRVAQHADKRGYNEWTKKLREQGQ